MRSWHRARSAKPGEAPVSTTIVLPCAESVRRVTSGCGRSGAPNWELHATAQQVKNCANAGCSSEKAIARRTATVEGGSARGVPTRAAATQSLQHASTKLTRLASIRTSNRPTEVPTTLTSSSSTAGQRARMPKPAAKASNAGVPDSAASFSASSRRAIISRACAKGASEAGASA